MADPTKNAQMDWRQQPNYPRPDYLSSSRKRLAPQLIFKGGILNAWGKKTAVAVNKAHFHTLTVLPEVDEDKADIAWLIYDLRPPTEAGQHYELFKERGVYTKRPDAPADTDLTQGEPLEKFLWRLETELEEVVV